MRKGSVFQRLPGPCDLRGQGSDSAPLTQPQSLSQKTLLLPPQQRRTVRAATGAAAPLGAPSTGSQTLIRSPPCDLVFIPGVTCSHRLPTPSESLLY